LYEVLDEIDRERSKQAELEKQLRLLRSEAIAEEEESAMALVALEVDRDCFREIVDALTETTQAVSNAFRDSSSQHLPLHVVRMLEYMPHDPRAVQCTKAKDEVYECQFYKSGKWKQFLEDLPPSIQTLPLLQLKSANNDDHHSSMMMDQDESEFVGQAPPKYCVLSNHSMTKRIPFDNDKIIHLPNNIGGGSWEWVSGWIVDKNPVWIQEIDDKGAQTRRNIRDAQGWCYVLEPKHFVNPELCSDDPLLLDDDDDSDAVATRPLLYRRRRWTRQRALRSYPYASQSTIAYLRLLAENSRLGVTRTQVSESLIDMKTKLTELEESLDSTREDLLRRRTEIQQTQQEIVETEASIQAMKKQTSKQQTLNQRDLSKQRSKLEDLRKQLEKVE